MQAWRRALEDLRRSGSYGTDDLPFRVVATVIVVAVAQLTDPGTTLDLVLLAPAAIAFALRPLVPRVPEEVIAAVVIVSVTAAIGRDGALEPAFFLGVMTVLFAAGTLGSFTRAGAIGIAGALSPLLVAAVLAPKSGIGWISWTCAIGFTFVLGRTVRRQDQLIGELEAAKQALAEQAVAEERRRIARELHDLAGHTLAAMVLHVTGARHVLRRDPNEAERALEDAEAVGRSSLDQIRAAVATLRTDERGTDPVLAGASDLGNLVDGYRRAGVEITAEIDAGAAAIEGPVGIALHRIAREALANVARHAPSNRVFLSAHVGVQDVQLAVSDEGRPPENPNGDGVHFGVLGMTERARSLGGELHAGPTDDGWQVIARIPLATPTRTPLAR